MLPQLSPENIRAARRDSSLRAVDLAEALGIPEAELIAAHAGQDGALSATRIQAHPDQVMPLMPRLGRIMSLTRNPSCVHERLGTFGDYRSGPHAAMVLGKEIDTRIFPSFWQYGFAVEEQTPNGVRRSLQFFDPSGIALQKIYLREDSNVAAWGPVLDSLRMEETPLKIAPRPAPDAPRADPGKRGQLIAEWQKMTDTHQFNRLSTRLGMNRLGAYRLAGAPLVRAVDPAAVASWLEAVSAARQKVILFVGNRGHIQIHWGRLDRIVPMGPWLNVLDPDFNLHLRGDHLAEVYVVHKPTKRGPAVSLEAFDADGGLIFQCFGQRHDDSDDLGTWQGILDALPDLAPDPTKDGSGQEAAE